MDVDAALQSQIRNIETRYGRPLSEWFGLIAASGLTKHTEVVAMLATVSFIDAALSHAPVSFPLQIAIWLWATVLFANFAESVAEGRGKAAADSLRKACQVSQRTTCARPPAGRSTDSGEFMKLVSICTSVVRTAVRRCEPLSQRVALVL